MPRTRPPYSPEFLHDHDDAGDGDGKDECRDLESGRRP